MSAPEPLAHFMKTLQSRSYQTAAMHIAPIDIIPREVPARPHVYGFRGRFVLCWSDFDNRPSVVIFFENASELVAKNGL